MKITQTEAVDQVLRVGARNSSLFQAEALRVVRSIAAPDLREMAASRLVDLAGTEARRITREIELAAEQRRTEVEEQLSAAWKVAHPPTPEQLAQQGRLEQARLRRDEEQERETAQRLTWEADQTESGVQYFHGFVSKAKRRLRSTRIAVDLGCPCPYCSGDRKIVDDAKLEMTRVVSTYVEDRAQTLAMHYTLELLAEPFPLYDGTSVLWGRATVEQHELVVRRETQNAVANVQLASRHQQAIDDLTGAGVSCLNDLVAA